MFDISFSELLLIFIVGLIVLGPLRLLVAVKTIMDWVHALSSLATTVQNELVGDLKLKEFQERNTKVKNIENMMLKMKSSMEESHETTELVKCSYTTHNSKISINEANINYNQTGEGNKEER